MSQRDLNEIEREIEETRERLASTIDQLSYRGRPRTILTRQAGVVRGFFLDIDGQPRVDNIVKTAGGVVGFMIALRVLRKVVG